MLDKPEIVAWIEPYHPRGVVASFVARDVSRTRRPATKLCPSPESAKQWIEAEAKALDASVEWKKGT